jgi:hypothetical protein
MDSLLEALTQMTCDISNKNNEDAVEKILDFYLQKLNKNQVLKEKSYIKHPNGSQKFPDFVIKINNNKYELECKSTKSGYKPMWNSGLPKPECIYVYTNTKENNTIIFLGNEIITPKLDTLLEEYKRRTKELALEFNEKIKNLKQNENPYKIEVYARNMFVQKTHLIKNKFQNIIKKIKLI